MIRGIVGSQSPIIRAPLPKDDPTRRSPDISRARALLGDWQPRVTLEEGLAATAADFRTRLLG
jgi:nucleoside-diphosphate-sugar epimerase